MAKDENLNGVEDLNDKVLQSENTIASNTMSVNNEDKALGNSTIQGAMSDNSVKNVRNANLDSTSPIEKDEKTLASDLQDNENLTIGKVENNLNIERSVVGEESKDNFKVQDSKNLATNHKNSGGNYVPLLQDNDTGCPPLQYRPRSSGAIYGAGYDAGMMQDNTRSLRTRKQKKDINDGLEDVDYNFKKPKPLWFKITLIVLTSILSIVGLFGLYLAYLESGYERIYNVKYLEVLDNRPANVTRAVSYEVVTYNLNYGAFSSDYTYYKSLGYNENGKQTKGSHSRAQSKERVEVNTKGSAGLLSTGSNANAEFFMLQEVDVNSTRTYYVNERQILKDVMVNYAEIFAETGSSKYVFSPLTSPVGKYNSGMLTYSIFDVDYAMRYSLPSNNEFPSKYSATDNCISVVKCLLAGSGEQTQLVLINVDLSMYEDSRIKESCLAEVYKYMKSEVDRGNYVIVGGSFSYLLYGKDGAFENKMKTPDWCKDLPECFNETKLNEIDCRIVKDFIAVELKTGTTRDSSVKYKKGETFEAITDGFIVSNNVITEKIEVMDNEFLYSAHNPVRLTFRLK